MILVVAEYKDLLSIFFFLFFITGFTYFRASTIPQQIIDSRQNYKNQNKYNSRANVVIFGNS